MAMLNNQRVCLNTNGYILWSKSLGIYCYPQMPDSWTAGNYEGTSICWWLWDGNLRRKQSFNPPKKAGSMLGEWSIALTKSISVTLSQLSCQSHDKTYKNIGSVTISRSDLWEVATMTTRSGKHSHSYGKWP